MSIEPAYRPINAQTVAAMSPAAQAEIAKARTLVLLEKATAHHAPAMSHGEGNTNHALLQKANHQDRAQAALSPTDNHSGQTAIQARLEGANLARAGVRDTTTSMSPSQSPSPAPTPNMPSRDNYRGR